LHGEFSDTGNPTMKAVAALITCHNRKAKTIACLERLFQQRLPPTTVLKVCLVDDGSTDGTADAVRERYPAVSVISADGSLFWCRGTRLAWEHAARSDPGYYLWLNDDTMLRQGALLTLLGTAEKTQNAACIVVGSCCDSATGQHTYGGQRLLGRHPAKLALIEPDAAAVKACDTFNGNCVLVTRAAYRMLGTMRAFRHSIGDTDYGLRARRRGIPMMLTPGFAAECAANPMPLNWRTLEEFPWAQRFRALTGPKGLPPGDWWRFLWTHAGMHALIYWPVPYLSALARR
jgi:GT2 family glycosyltransferase